MVRVCVREQEGLRFSASLLPFIFYTLNFLQGAFIGTTCGQTTDPAVGAGEDQEVVKAEATGHLASPLDPRLGWGHSRFGDSDVVWRALEAQAAETALDVMAGLSLRAVVGAQCTLVQV